ncbi:MAG TPA: hypothetical protein VMH87_15120 [Pseudomonadales bacterium]|nr:hypothetical protein [Pseudomonadales bacterium]
MKHGLNTDKAGIRITRIPYEEPYHLRLFIEASNGQLIGSLEYYCHARDLNTLGNQLLGFLGKKNEKIVYKLGSEKPEDNFAFLFSLQVISLDTTGHSAIWLRLNNNSSPPWTEVCEFCIATDVADVNRLGSLLVAFGKLDHRVLDWSVKDGILLEDVE